MLNFYDTSIIPNLLKYFKVKNIILSGLKDEDLINEILNYNASFIGINIDKTYKNMDNLIGNPLNTLTLQNNYEAIFINDDPNWYTTYNELNIIKRTNDEFPLVFICNNKFPHKYRDSYFNPKNIPKEYLHNYAKELPISHDNKKIIINDQYYHSCDENGPKNGVSTAIDDFLKENPNIGILDLKFIEEITILYPLSTISTIRINNTKNEIMDKKINIEEISSTVIENKLLFDYINKHDLHTENIDKNLIHNYEDKLQIQDSKLKYKNSQIVGVETKLNIKELQIKNIESKLINKEKKIENLENQIKNKNEEMDYLKKELREEKSKSKNLNADFNFKIESANETIFSLKNEIYKKETEFEKKETNFKKQINKSNYKLNQLTNVNSELNSTKELLTYIKKRNLYQTNQLNAKEYCITCYKEEINNKKSEIDYLKKDTLLKKLFSPFSYLYLILKSNPHELSINFKLLKTLKNSKCFDIGYYLNNNEDLQKSKWIIYFSPELHYVCKGFNENREFNKKYYNRNSKEELLNYLLLCERKE